MDEPRNYMLRALTLARKALGRTAPNPAVGAVIVRDCQIVGEGFHPAAGEPHAEIFALSAAQGRAAGADMYLTLEPCSHQGRTGPCADALIAAGIKRVYVGIIDPNPQVSGRGIQRLRAAGIQVEVGLCSSECHQLIQPFAWHIKHKLPYTLYKAAMTFDGQLATKSGDSRWVSGPESRNRVHQLRDQVDAIMVGVETILVDNPQLTTRLEHNSRDPLRVVVDSRLRTPLASKVVTQTSKAVTMIATTKQADKLKITQLEAAGCEVLVLPESAGKVSLPALWQELGRRDCQYLLLEGGRTLAGAALAADLIQRIQLYIAPKLVGGQGVSGLFAGAGCKLMREAKMLENLTIETLGEDLFLTAEVRRCLPD